MADNADIT